jgi:hypothetical protein
MNRSTRRVLAVLAGATVTLSLSVSAAARPVPNYRLMVSVATFANGPVGS